MIWLHFNKFPVIILSKKQEKPLLKVVESLREAGTQSDLCSRKMSPATGQERRGGRSREAWQVQRLGGRLRRLGSGQGQGQGQGQSPLPVEAVFAIQSLERTGPGAEIWR